MIEIENLHFRYRGACDTALRGINLHIAAGEFVLLTGPSGCGKSTLARALNGLIPQSITGQMWGRVLAGGLDTRQHSVPELAGQVGMVFQIPETQLFNLTVEEEVAFGPRNLGLEAKTVGERVAFALSAVGLEGYRARSVYQLSGGEKQRVVIASVLAMQPPVLVLDEPLSNLDEAGTSMVLETLGELNRELGLTVLLIEHRVASVAEFARRVIVMSEGRVVLDGEPGVVFEEKERLAALGVRLPGPPQLVEGPKRFGAPQAPAITFEGVSFSYDGRRVLDDISFQIGRGEFAALVGENGAGKTTLARLILGLLRPDAGEIKVAADGKLQLGQDIGLLLQNPLEQLFCNTVGEEVAFGLENFGLPSSLAEEVLAEMDLASLCSQDVWSLSCGQKQRLALAAVLALSPSILVLDEPTVGQDWGHLKRLMDFIARLNRQGATIVLVTQDMDLVRTYARRSLRLHGGKILEVSV